MAFELTDEGLNTQTVDEIFDEMAASLRAKAAAAGVPGAANIDVSETAPFGQLLGMAAEREFNRQQVTLAVYNSRFPSRATGDALAQGALITGTVKRDATYSVVGVLVTLTAGTTLLAGARANVDGDTEALFETLEDVTNGGVATDDIAVEMTAVESGAVRALSGTLTVINTPASGWLAVTNPFDAQVGSSIETDPALRLRREEELRSQGSTTLAAIVADVEEIEGVIEAIGFENKTAAEVDGLPPHSFEVVVWDGTSEDASDNAIAQAIFDASPAGIASASAGETHTGTAIEAETEEEYEIEFTRAEDVDLYFEYDLTVDPDVYPIDGDTQVKAAVVKYVNEGLLAVVGEDRQVRDATSIGDDVIAASLATPAFSVAGVLDVTAIPLGVTVSPVGTGNIAIGPRQIGRADSSRIVVAT